MDTMSKIVPISRWASANGLTRDQALNLARAGKIEGAALRKVELQRWYVPADARPIFADRRRRDARKPGRPDARPA